MRGERSRGATRFRSAPWRQRTELLSAPSPDRRSGGPMPSPRYRRAGRRPIWRSVAWRAISIDAPRRAPTAAEGGSRACCVACAPAYPGSLIGGPPPTSPPHRAGATVTSRRAGVKGGAREPRPPRLAAARTPQRHGERWSRRAPLSAGRCRMRLPRPTPRHRENRGARRPSARLAIQWAPVAAKCHAPGRRSSTTSVRRLLQQLHPARHAQETIRARICLDATVDAPGDVQPHGLLLGGHPQSDGSGQSLEA